MFMITKETDIFGKILKNSFGADFMVLKFETPFKNFKTDQEMDEAEAHLASLAKSRELKLSAEDQINPYSEKQISTLKSDNQDLEAQIREKDEEVRRLMVELETANKSIYDKERMLKQQTREI